MDARSKVQFINSVAKGQNICCPQCKAINDPDSKFCFSCGFSLMQAPVQAMKAQRVCCPQCRAVNDAGSKFCFSCGAFIEQAVVRREESPALKENNPFSPSAKEKAPHDRTAAKAENVQKAEAKIKAENVPKKQYIPVPVTEVDEEPESVFAEGLPSWNVEPPVIMVRRKKRK